MPYILYVIFQIINEMYDFFFRAMYARRTHCCLCFASTICRTRAERKFISPHVLRMKCVCVCARHGCSIFAEIEMGVMMKSVFGPPANYKLYYMRRHWICYVGSGNAQMI